MPETTVTIQRLGHHGDGIAEGPIFAAGTLPGEVVSGIAQGDRLTEIRILEPSPDRVRAPCRHAKTCGGCALQHASETFTANWKAQVVETALSAQGINSEIAGVETSPPQSRRRATFHAQRTKKGSIIGFFGRSSHNLVDTPDCLLLDPAISNARPALEDLTRLGASRSTTIAIAVTASEVGLDVAVSEAKDPDRALLTSLAECAGKHGLARLVWNGEIIAQAQAPVQKMGPAMVAPPSGAFLQATQHGQAVLTSLVQSTVQNAGRVVDLFSGCGTFALPLTRTQSVHAVEGLSELLDAAHAGWAKVGGLHKLTTETRDLFRRPLMADELAQFGAAIIDPPRAGAAAQISEIARSGLPVVAAVSCNPVTFARDAATLIAAGFRMGPVTVVDQFRWSPHVELFAAFQRD